MSVTKSIVSTSHGAAYLKRLCRHFSHKLDVSLNDKDGMIHFPFGDCAIEVTDAEMDIRIDVPDPAELDRAEHVVESHLLRMANKDEPVVNWTRES